MYYSLYPKYDTTLYENHPNRNSGIDQIVELNKIVSNTPDPDGFYWDATTNSRILMQFDTVRLASLISQGAITGSATYYLSLRATEAAELPISYSLEVAPVSQSWSNGQGHYNDYPEITEGASWSYRDGYYQGNGTLWITGSLSAGTTASNASVVGGGTWYTGSTYVVTQSFDYVDVPDIRINVTDIVNHWLDGDIPNNGFIIKRLSADENSNTHLGSIKFFGKDTHTIFTPRLEAVWDDSVFVTGSLQEISGDYTVYFPNIKQSYRNSGKTKIRLIAREEFPRLTYATSSNYLDIKRFPTSSYYAIQDSVTNDFIIPFDTGSTVISCDTQGNYFYLNMNSFSTERYYKIVVKTVDSDQVEVITDGGFYFKVVN